MKVTVPKINEMAAEGKRLTCLTAYDASFAAILDRCEIDLILVGDSLGNVIQGAGSTLAVSVDDMAYHTRCVSGVVQRALVIGDMPFLSYADRSRAFACSEALMGEGGAEMVKLEGAGPMLDIIEALSARDIPVCAHLGLTPQSVHKLGGYRVQGRAAAAAQELLRQARAVADAGADLLVLECVPSELARQITDALEIPTIGIGAGPHTSGQVLVLYDALGISHGKRPKFSKDFLAASGGSVENAVRLFAEEVRAGAFPTEAHSYA